VKRIRLYYPFNYFNYDKQSAQALLKNLRGITVALVAEKIETQEEYTEACKEGFTLFQGYYFCRPALIESHKIPENSLSHIEILQHLRSQVIDVRKLTALLKRDASLTYRLLRLVNSPMCAMRQEVRSIQEALLAVGEDTFRRVAMLAIASELNSGQPAEILRMAFIRGRFCELAAGICDLDSTEQYLLGLLSLLPAMLRLPMEQLAPTLPMRDKIRDALLGDDIHERILLRWLECHEYGDWEACDSVAQANGRKRPGITVQNRIRPRIPARFQPHPALRRNGGSPADRRFLLCRALAAQIDPVRVRIAVVLVLVAVG